jgi:hypothetical protein
MIRWDAGGEATLVRIEGESVSLISTTPHPPGSRIRGSLQDGTGTTIVFKTHASKKRDDGRFDLEGRLLDLRREVRERLERLV